MKHLLKLGGMTPEEILHILDVADEYTVGGGVLDAPRRGQDPSLQSKP